MPTTTLRGRPVAWIEADDGAPAAPLLLVHGFTGSKEDFGPQLPALGRDRRVIACDLPGHGDSVGPDDPGGYGLGALADWVLAFADEVCLGDFHLLGHSLGGLVAQRVGALASERLRSLILADTGMGAPREEACDLATAIATAVRDEGLEAAWKLSQASAAEYRPHLEVDPAREEFVHRRFLALEPAAVIGEARSIIGASPLHAFLRGIDVPVLVLHGEHDDVWLPSEQEALAGVTNGARLAVIPESIHAPQLENPDAWRTAVTTFLPVGD